MFMDFEVCGGIRFTSVGMIHFGVEYSLKNREKMFLEALLLLASGHPYVCIHSLSASLDVINTLFSKLRMFHSTVYHFWSLANRTQY